MANTTSALRPEIWSLIAIDTLRANAKTPRLVHRNFEQEIAAFGDTVNVHSPTAATARDKAIGTDATFDDLNPGQVQIVLDQWKYAGFEVEDLETALSKRDIVDFQIPEEVKALANAADVSLLSLHSDADTNVGTPGSDIDETDILTGLKEYWDNGGLADDQIYAAVATKEWENLLLRSNVIQANALHAGTQNDAPLIDGWKGGFMQRHGVGIYMDQNIQSTAGTPTTTHNLLFHRNAMAFVQRPLGDTVMPGLGVLASEVVDEVTGLAIRTKVTYRGKGMCHECVFDILYGVKTLNSGLLIDVNG